MDDSYENLTSTPQQFPTFLSVTDFEKRAREVLPKATVAYYCGGAAEELTLARNQHALKKWEGNGGGIMPFSFEPAKQSKFRLLIRPFTLRDVSRVDMGVTFRMKTKDSYFTTVTLPHPLGIAPTGFQCLAHPDGERATVQAAGETGTLMILSSFSTTSLEDVAAAAPPGTRLWFQCSLCKDKEVTRSLAERAIAAGYEALVVTGDPITEGRVRDVVRSGFQLPSHLGVPNFEPYLRQRGTTDINGGEGEGEAKLDPRQQALELMSDGFTWEGLEWLIKLSSIPVVIKGVLRPEDAERAIAAGVGGIIVSNLGGRSLDSAPSTIEALPEIAAVVKGRCPLFMDGGIRSGTDILKAVALGAQAVFIGRPVLYGLAVGGKDGVKQVISLLTTELKNAMKLAGYTTLTHLQNTRSVVVHQSYYRSKF